MRKYSDSIITAAAILGIVLVAAAVSLLALSFIFNISDYGISIASFSATLFMLMTKPKSSIRRVLAAYALAGCAAFAALQLRMPMSYSCGLSAILAIVLMMIFEVPHAPAVSITVSFVLNSMGLWKIIAVILASFVLLYILKTAFFLVRNPDRIVNRKKIRFNFKKKDPADFIIG